MRRDRRKRSKEEEKKEKKKRIDKEWRKVEKMRV